MPKKNKLNSNNPKWKNQKDKQPDVDKILVKETKGVKVYFIFKK